MKVLTQHAFEYEMTQYRQSKSHLDKNKAKPVIRFSNDSFSRNTPKGGHKSHVRRWRSCRKACWGWLHTWAFYYYRNYCNRLTWSGTRCSVSSEAVFYSGGSQSSGCDFLWLSEHTLPPTPHAIRLLPRFWLPTDSRQASFSVCDVLRFRVGQRWGWFYIAFRTWQSRAFVWALLVWPERSMTGGRLSLFGVYKGALDRC